MVAPGTNLDNPKSEHHVSAYAWPMFSRCGWTAIRFVWQISTRAMVFTVWFSDRKIE